MAKSVDLTELKERIYKIQLLLDDPLPGLATWNMFLGEHLKWISDFWHESTGE